VNYWRNPGFFYRFNAKLSERPQYGRFAAPKPGRIASCGTVTKGLERRFYRTFI